MHLHRRGGNTVEVQITRCAGIVDGRGFVAQIIGRTYRRIDAHMAHRADDHDFANALFLEQIAQPGLAEGIREVLGDDRLAGRRTHCIVDLSTCAAGNEDRAAGDFMTDVDDQITFRAGVIHDACGIGGSGLDPMQREIA
ncbi:hypothetical protein D3C72_1410080 [compost metagenome]